MKIIFTPQAMEHWQYWEKNNPAVATRIKKLLSDISEHPFYGMGKPEALKYELSGKWSRRISARHRIIYSVSENLIEVYVFSMKYHYSKKA